MGEVLEKPAHRDFKIPPLTPQTISTKRYSPRLMRFNFLELISKELGLTKGAEIGCLAGKTLRHLMINCPDLWMVGVDLFEAQPDNPGPEGWEHYPHRKHYDQCCTIARTFAPRLQIVRDWSTEAAKQFPDSYFDFVFIDADHSYKGCKADIEAWMPKVKDDGFLFGHDINWPGVKKACDELVPGYEIGPNVVWFRPKVFKPDWARRWK